MLFFIYAKQAFLPLKKKGVTMEINQKLPDYVVFDLESHNEDEVQILKHPAKELTFPLSEEDLYDIKTLEAKFDQEDGADGLAAVQIGIAKKIIVFRADDPALKKFRSDFIQMMPKTIWINPTYKGLETHGFSEDYEGCYSVKDVAGIVKRFNKIHYTAYDIKGHQVKGLAEGFLARIIQHEIDHINGVLFTDIATKILSREEYAKIYEMQKNK
jgi:peptide deformylase